MQETPAALKTAAIVQIVSGAVNLLLMWWILGGAISSVGGCVSLMCTSGLCPTYCCGMFNFVLIPIGLFEIISGILGLTNPKGAGTLMKIVAVIEMVSILFGGLGSLISGILTFRAMGDPDVADFLQS